MRSRIILISICALLLAGCNAQSNLTVKTKLVDRPELILPKTLPISQSGVKWIVLTPQNYSKRIDELQASGQSITLFALTSKGYENLSLNVAELRKYIQQQNTVIAAYKEYYKNDKNAPKDVKK